MSPLALAALILVLNHQSILSMTAVEPRITSSVVYADGTKVVQRVLGETDCELTQTPGKPDTWRVSRLTYSSMEVLEHEALHAASCAFNGRTNGGLLPFAPTWVDAEHEWVAYCQDNPPACIKILEGATNAVRP